MHTAELIRDFKNFAAHDHTKQSMTRKGSALVKWATNYERLNTPTEKYNLSYNEVLNNPEKYIDIIPCVRRMYEKYKNENQTDAEIWRSIVSLYLGGIPGIFKPSTAAYFLTKYPPRVAVLDPTMGWGGRLVGAAALNVPQYIGFDSNTNLKVGYDNLRAIIQPHTTTQIAITFIDAVAVDYSGIKYDVVLTSLPYFNIEKYAHQPDRTKTQWVDEFYRPLLTNLWNNLMPGGHLLLNVNEKTYVNALQPILGDCHESEPIIRAVKFAKIPANNKHKPTQEKMYIWHK